MKEKIPLTNVCSEMWMVEAFDLIGYGEKLTLDYDFLRNFEDSSIKTGFMIRNINLREILESLVNNFKLSQ